jgi:hypothetical protein
VAKIPSLIYRRPSQTVRRVAGFRSSQYFVFFRVNLQTPSVCTTDANAVFPSAEKTNPKGALLISSA